VVLPLTLSIGDSACRIMAGGLRVGGRSLTERWIVALRYGMRSCQWSFAPELVMLWIPLAFCAGHI